MPERVNKLERQADRKFIKIPLMGQESSLPLDLRLDTFDIFIKNPKVSCVKSAF